MINYRVLLNLYQGLSTRERVLVACTLVVATWGIWITTFGGSLADRVSNSQQSLMAVQQQMSVVEAKFSALQVQGSSGELRALKERRQALLDDVELAQGELDQLLARFVPPREVPFLLEDLLEQYQGLQLAGLKTEASEKVTVTVQDRVAASTAVDQPMASIDVYRHPFLLELKGNFHDVVGYLDQLERGEWQLQWRSLDYVVENYPQASVVLRVETLSRSAEWIGV